MKNEFPAFWRGKRIGGKLYDDAKYRSLTQVSGLPFFLVGGKWQEFMSQSKEKSGISKVIRQKLSKTEGVDGDRDEKFY